MRAITLEQLADEAGVPADLVHRLVQLDQVRPLDDGRFDARDAAIVSTVRSLLAAGIDLDDLTWAIEAGHFGLQTVGRLFLDPSPRGETYQALVASLGEHGSRVAAVYGALGLPEPAPDDRLREDEAAIVREFVSTWAGLDPDGGADVRVARLASDGLRRLAEGWLDVWDEHARPRPEAQGAPRQVADQSPADMTDPNQNPAVRAAALARRLISWLFDRQVELTLQQRIIEATEGLLVAADRLTPRIERPPAIAFVDLSGYTSLTERHGDEVAADAAARLHDLADAAAASQGGRVVKLLGDGAIMRFNGAQSALRATLRLVREIGAAGLPPAHAGIAAGRIVIRDGDVYGRTVNLAARIATTAGPGEVVVEEGVVVALPRGIATFEPIGRVELRGFSEPVAVWRARDPKRR